jgi:hypothetical protein
MRTTHITTAPKFRKNLPYPLCTLPHPRHHRDIRVFNVAVTRYEAPALLPRTNKDFVRENFDKAPEFVKAVKTKTSKEVPRTEPLGAIPAYLVGRKKELEEAQEQARLARAPPSAPPGQRLVPEEERLATLDRLRCRMRELEGELARLPLTMRSLLSQQKRSAIEQGMEEVENAIRTFSKQKVFVVL